MHSSSNTAKRPKTNSASRRPTTQSSTARCTTTVNNPILTIQGHWMTCINAVLVFKNSVEYPYEIGYYSYLQDKKRDAQTEFEGKDFKEERKIKPYKAPIKDEDMSELEPEQQTLYNVMFDFYSKIDLDIYEDSLRLDACLHSSKTHQHYGVDRTSYFVGM